MPHSCQHPAVRLAGRILFFTGIVLVLVGVTAALLTLLISWTRGNAWQDNFSASTVCSLIIWLFIAVFHWRKEVISIPFGNRNEFIVDVREVMQEMGYEVKAQAADLSSFRFRPRFRSLLLGGSVQLAIEAQTGRISGPKVCLEMFRNRLRLRHHINKMQQTMVESSRLLNDSLHQRVQVALRLNPEQLQSVLDEVIKVLVAEGEVVCYLKILASNQTGIPQSTIEGRIRAWLKNQGIAADIQRDPVKRPGADAVTV